MTPAPVNLTALIRCKPGAHDAVLKALLDVGAYVRAHEPGTLGYTVVQSDADDNLLVTQERFRDRDAMVAHNEGAGSKAFFAAAQDLLAEVTIVTGEEAFGPGL